ncbi:hypothetical protein [Micromonospora sp. LOL_023]|uniref:tetratricopeptide repeat protein n=1 Tax=Micromonospora sp. LOL_023 TaxID=3345418 RepID=UPI003A89AB8C
MRSFEPQLAGIHPSIEISGQSDMQTLPAHIPREVDVKLRALLLAPESMKFVLLLGGSSVGKTRAAYEGIRACLPEYQVLVPSDNRDILWMLDRKLRKPLVVWLDELQRFLIDQPDHFDKGHLLALWSLRKPVVVIGTMWPDHYQAFLEPSRGDRMSEKSDRARQVINMAQLLYVQEHLAPTEMSTAKVLAEKDPRIKIALDDKNYGVTQVLAGAPDLVDRWIYANRQEKSVITAAIDIGRMGIGGPLSDLLLKTAAQVYMDSETLARAPVDWYDSAISYAIKPLKGAVSALIPVAGIAGITEGYRLADYLIQYGGKAMSSQFIPNALWRIVAEQVHDPTDLKSLGDAAELRGLYGYAESALRRSMAGGNSDAGNLLVRLLEDQGRSEDAIVVARSAAATGDARSVEVFLDHLQGLGTEEAFREMRKAVDSGIVLPDIDARSRLASMFSEIGDLESAEAQLKQALLEGRNGAHDSYANFLRRAGRLDEADAQALLAARAGSYLQYLFLASRLVQKGSFAEAEAFYHEASAQGNHDVATSWWRRILVENERFDEAQKLVGSLGGVELDIATALKRLGQSTEALEMYLKADEAGDIFGSIYAAEMLEGQGRFEEAYLLRSKMAKNPDFPWGVEGLLGHLAKRDRLDLAVETLKELAMIGRFVSSDDLGDALIRSGRIDEAVIMYRRSAFSGTDGSEVHSLWNALLKHGHEDVAMKVRRYGFQWGDDFAA